MFSDIIQAKRQSKQKQVTGAALLLNHKLCRYILNQSEMQKTYNVSVRFHHMDILGHFCQRTAGNRSENLQLALLFKYIIDTE